MAEYVTQEFELLDKVCADHYGTDKVAQALPLVFRANQNISRKDIRLPAGLTIILPDLPAEQQQGVSLWS